MFEKTLYSGLPLAQDIKIPWLFPDLFPCFPDQSNIQKLRHVVLVWLYTLLIIVYMSV